MNLTLDAGATATQARQIIFGDRGTSEWQVQADASNNFSLGDLLNSKSRLVFAQTASPAASGTLRMPNNDTGICFRNAANTADLCTKVDASNIFNLPSVTGFGAGTAAAVTTTTKGPGGSGPTTPQTVVQYMEVNISGTVYWIPLMQ